MAEKIRLPGEKRLPRSSDRLIERLFMNKLLNNMERKLGRYAIPRLTFVMICCYVVGYMLQLINPNIAEFMTLEPGLILRGEVWRIITWIVIPPASLDLSGIGLIFTLIMLVFYLSIGTSLERAW